MISHGYVYNILSAPLGHVTVDATVRARVFPRRDLLIEGRRVALTADCGVVLLCRFAARSVMRIVAGGAEHLAVALQKTRRAAEAISRVDDLEFVFPAGARRLV